jgi:hypothetical protein
MSTLNTCTSSSRPATPSQGDILYETDTYKTIIYDGSQWREYQSINSPYDLDGTNSTTVRPLVHFDAAKMNGVDSSGNPSNGSSVSTWTSRIGDNIAYQNASASQPTWYSSGANSQPYLDLNNDFFHLRKNFGVPAHGEFTVFWIAYHNYKFAPFGRVYDGTQGWLFYWNGYQIYAYHGLGGGTLSGNFSAGEDTDSAWFFTRERTSGSGYGDSSVSSSFAALNGNSTVSGTTSQDDAIDISQIGRCGGTFHSVGKLYEVMWFESHLSDTDLNSLGAYANTRYSVSWTDF